ncbi:MAG: serine hydrolase [Pseudomonadota bacterium]
MKHILVLLTLLSIQLVAAEPTDRFDYFASNRALIQRGVQAVLMCNGLFTSNRSIEQVFAQELAYLPQPLGTAGGGDYIIDRRQRAVAVGLESDGPAVRAAYRDGIGCVVMAPDQDFSDIDTLPQLPAMPVADRRDVPWPIGDKTLIAPLPATVNEDALAAASDWVFDRDTPEQNTLSLLIVHNGRIIHERYAEGIDETTRTRTWSTAKSIAATLIGMLVDDGKLTLDAPLELEWLPANTSDAPDPRNAITLRHVMNMSSGLYPVDSFGMEYVTGSGLAYWAGASSQRGARNRGLIHAPGTHWDYENYDTLLAVLAMKQALGSQEAYEQFPRKALLDRIGMHNTLLSMDRFGDFILSSQVYTNARDLARFGLLYLQDGIWQGERLISQQWIDFVRTPAPSAKVRGNDYGGQFWLVPDRRTDVPKDAYATAGNRGQYVVIVPSYNVVIVRRGLDYGQQGFDRWDMTLEVLKAISPSNDH